MPFNGSAHLARCAAGRCSSVPLLKGSNGCWQPTANGSDLGEHGDTRVKVPLPFSPLFTQIFFLRKVSNSIFYFHRKVAMPADFLTGNERSGARKGHLFLDFCSDKESPCVTGFCNPFCSFFGSFTGYRWICYTGKAPDNAGDLQGHGKKKMPRGQTCALES